MNPLSSYGRPIFSWAFLAVLAISPGFALAQQAGQFPVSPGSMVPPPPPAPGAQTLTSQGHADLKVRPDSLSVSIMVDTQADDLSKARSENNRKMQDIIKALKGLNLAGLKLETQMLSVSPVESDAQKNKLPKTVGYQVSNSLNVSVIGVDSDGLGDSGSHIIDTALNAGATNVGGLNFYVNDLSASQAKVLALAVKDAQTNAEAMATAADVQLNGVYRVDSPPQFGHAHPPGMMMRAMAVNGGGATIPVESGDVTISSDVTVVFKFRSP